MKSKIKQKKGISLIVLVITIIIMIIIAAAIILSLNASGVISRANKAKADSDLANKKHAATLALAEYSLLVNSNGTSMKDAEATQYVREKLQAQGIDASDVSVVEGKIVIGGVTVSAGSGASAVAKGVQLGDYVDYTPTAVTSATYRTFDEDEWEESDTYFATQTGTDALRWRYMGIDASGKALLVADRPTTDMIFLYGKDGYVNGTSKLNGLCNELYSNALGDARSINVDDVNRVLGASPIGKYYSKTGDEINNADNLTVGELVSEKGETALTSTYTPEADKSINDYKADYYYYQGTIYKEETTNEHKLMFKNSSNSNIRYWLTSPCTCVYFDSGFATFDVLYVNDCRVGSCSLYFSNDSESGEDCSVRPVIVLKSNVQFGAKDGNGVWSIN